MTFNQSELRQQTQKAIAQQNKLMQSKILLKVNHGKYLKEKKPKKLVTTVEYKWLQTTPSKVEKDMADKAKDGWVPASMAVDGGAIYILLSKTTVTKEKVK